MMQSLQIQAHRCQTNTRRVLSHYSRAPTRAHCRRFPPHAALQQPSHQCGDALLRLLAPPHDLSAPLQLPRRGACCRFDCEDAPMRLARESLSGYQCSVRLPRGAVCKITLVSIQPFLHHPQTPSCIIRTIVLPRPYCSRVSKIRPSRYSRQDPPVLGPVWFRAGCADGNLPSFFISDTGVALSRRTSAAA